MLNRPMEPSLDIESCGCNCARDLRGATGVREVAADGPSPALADDDDGDLERALARSYLQAQCSRTPRVATFAVGEMIAGRYIVERMLSQGGMGEVYVAFDQLLSQRVALKAVLATAADDPHAVGRLLREVRVARSIRHPNVCGVYDAGAHNQGERDVCYFMTMELIEGRSLRDWRATGSVSISSASRLLQQLLLAVDAIHSACFVHGDLKADNIMVSGLGGSERALVVDFGLAAPIEERSVDRSIAGSVGYMAPEQLRGQPPSVRTDIFAIGVVMFELLAGRRPFERERRLRSASFALGSVLSDVPAIYRPIVERCLCVASAERYPGAKAVLCALEKAAQALPPHLPADPR